MRTQLTILVIALSILFTCGALALNRAIQLKQTVETNQTRVVALHTDNDVTL